MAYATPADLASYMQVPSVDTASALLILQLVSDAMDAYTGQSLGQQDVIALVLDGTGSAELVLPGFPVTAVASIEVRSRDLSWTLLADGVDYAWSTAGIVRRLTGAADPAGPIAPAWPARPASVRVSYSRGTATPALGAKTVCLGAAARMFANPTGVSAEQVGGMSLRYGKSGEVEFSTLEQKILDRLTDPVIA